MGQKYSIFFKLQEVTEKYLPKFTFQGKSTDFAISTRQFSPIFAKYSLQFYAIFVDCIRQFSVPLWHFGLMY